MKRTLSLLLLILCGIHYTTVLGNNPEQSIFDSRVGLVDEFMRRFNLEDSPYDSTEVAVSRIVNLFNAENFTSETDPLYTAAVEFASAAVKSGTILSYTDSLWYAKAQCIARYKKEQVSFDLTLKVEPLGRDMYKWSILKASGDIFRLSPSATGTGFRLMPDDHEVNFMSLHEITSLQTSCITNYAASDVNIDPTTVFFTMVYDGQLEIDHVSSLEFIFCQVPGWRFTVRHFDRESTNSGWLIDTILKL